MRLAVATFIFAVLAPFGVTASVLQENIVDSIAAMPVLAHATTRAPSWKWANCSDDEAYGVDVTSIEISPDPPQKGENLTVTVSGFVKEVIEEEAYAFVKVKMGLMQVLNREYDICEEARNSDSEIQCPVQEGDYTISQTAQLPKLIPPQNYRVTVEGYTVHDSPLLCVNIDVDFRTKYHR